MKLPADRYGLVLGLIVAVNQCLISGSSGQDNGPAKNATEIKQEELGFPAGLKQFSGMLIGKLIERDIEQGTFTVKVDYVARVWENNKADAPRSVVGKEIAVNGVSGKWLDELLLVRPGETVEFEAQHRGGNQLTFPGEWLQKVPAFDASNHPVPPAGFRGFAGTVTGTVTEKSQTSRELHLKIDGIETTAERNKAETPSDVLGKAIVLAGFWARMSEPFENLEVGDRVRAGVLHRVPQSDHFTVQETAEKIAQQNSPSKSIPKGMVGFRGILQGTLISKDVEQGTLVVQAERVTRTWKANRASDVKSCTGHSFLVQGISGKWIDVLITLKVGESIEVEAFHNGPDHLDFVSEWLKKVE